jgi:hypothetical protein
MLGRNSFTTDEIRDGKAAVAQQLAAFRELTEAGAAESVYFHAALLALDRRYVHRVRAVSGKDGNPLNEVELIADSLMTNDGVLRGTTVIRYAPEKSVLGIAIGDRINLTAADFERLAAGFFEELERRFG